MPASGMLGRLPSDPARIAMDLAAVEPHGFVDSYGEFVCGSWRTCMLFNATGDGRDADIRDYPGAAQLTEQGQKLPYFTELIASHFDLDRLRFARLTRLAPDSVVVPHRDYLELRSQLVRIHVPVRSTAEAYASEGETVYRMGVGEVWFLDATRVHSIANFSPHNRIHLLLDFAASDPSSVLRQPPAGPVTMPAASIVPRRALRAGEREALTALAGVVDPVNFMDVLAILIKRYFLTRMDVLDVFGWMREIAAGSGDPDVLDRLRRLESRSLTAR